MVSSRCGTGGCLRAVQPGLMYDNGEGVPQDDAEAVRWYRLAAEQGNASAQYNLGLMYANGKVSLRTTQKQSGGIVSLPNRGLSAAQSRPGLDVPTAKDEVVLRGRRRGSPVVPSRCGTGECATRSTTWVRCTTTDEGVPQDDAEAVRWYRLAAEQGHAYAQYNLGVMYDTGEGVPQDDAEAVRWYRLGCGTGACDRAAKIG